MTSQLYSPVLPTGETKTFSAQRKLFMNSKPHCANISVLFKKLPQKGFKKKLKIFKECSFRLLSSSYALSLEEIILLDVFFIDVIVTAQLL